LSSTIRLFVADGLNILFEKDEFGDQIRRNWPPTLTAFVDSILDIRRGISEISYVKGMQQPDLIVWMSCRVGLPQLVEGGKDEFWEQTRDAIHSEDLPSISTAVTSWYCSDKPPEVAKFYSDALSAATKWTVSRQGKTPRSVTMPQLLFMGVIGSGILIYKGRIVDSLPSMAEVFTQLDDDNYQ
jgi:hypothetical protein